MEFVAACSSSGLSWSDQMTLSETYVVILPKQPLLLPSCFARDVAGVVHVFIGMVEQNLCSFVVPIIGKFSGQACNVGEALCPEDRGVAYGLRRK